MDGSDTNPEREPATNPWPGGVADDDNGHEHQAPRAPEEPRIFEPVRFDPPAGTAPDLSALGGRTRSAYVPRGTYQPPPAPEPQPEPEPETIAWKPTPLPDDDWTPPAEWTPPEWTPPADDPPPSTPPSTPLADEAPSPSPSTGPFAAGDRPGSGEPETVGWQAVPPSPAGATPSVWGPPPSAPAAWSAPDEEPTPPNGFRIDEAGRSTQSIEDSAEGWAEPPAPLPSRFSAGPVVPVPDDDYIPVNQEPLPGAFAQPAAEAATSAFAQPGSAEPGAVESAHDGPAFAAPAYGASAYGGLGRDDSAQDGPGQDGPGQDGPGQDGPGQDGPGQDESAYGAAQPGPFEPQPFAGTGSGSESPAEPAGPSPAAEPSFGGLAGPAFGMAEPERQQVEPQPVQFQSADFQSADFQSADFQAREYRRGESQPGEPQPVEPSFVDPSFAAVAEPAMPPPFPTTPSPFPTEPLASGPAQTEPFANEPFASEPVDAEQVDVEPVDAEPSGGESAPAERFVAESSPASRFEPGPEAAQPIDVPATPAQPEADAGLWRPGAWQPVEAEIVEPEPVQAAWVGPGIVDAEVIEPEPTGPDAVESVAREPEPIAAPEPVAYEPEPVAYEPEPVAYEPEPVAYEPEPVAYEPEPVAAPEPVVFEPVAASEAVAYEAEPVAAPEPVAYEPEPEPEPVAHEPGPVAAPEPLAAPFAAASMPEPVEPGPVTPEPVAAAPFEPPTPDAPAADVPTSDVTPEPGSYSEPGPESQPEPAGVPNPAQLVGASAAAASNVDEYPDPLPQPTGWREVGFDTVIRAAHTPWEHQPYGELGLQEDEYAKIRQLLGRRPTESELAMYAVMWSEHCSYKSSKIHLRQFGEKAPPSDRVLAGIGENAGVVKISDQIAVTFKVESHNHPSFVEPHQGAATGVGGIVRDILAMGARPVAVMDPLRFGAADHEDTKRVLPGVVSGISNYGNCLGLPNIGGEVVFDACYQGNPLVNALCVGVLPVDRLQNKAAAGPGNVVVLIGAKTGRDGIGGVSVLASATFDAGGEKRRPSVQVGDPFLEKLLIEACLEIYDLNLVVGIQDLGGAGLTCALSETAAAAGTGMAVNLDLVPLREASMTPHEVLSSESQERMLLIVTPENLPVVLSLCARWGVLATAIGEVTPAEEEGGRLRIWWRGDVIVDVPPGSLADDGPIYARPMREPNDRELMAFDRAETLVRPETPEQLRETLLRLAGSPNLCDKSWVTEQYDRYVLGNTVLAQPEDAGVLRIDEQTGLGVALSVDGNGRYARLDPYAGARLALAEAYRNVAVTGATPVAVTNCLNFGSPEDPGVMWQFAEAVRGLADGCQELGIPVTGGNVSFYNQTGGAPIHPTPIVGVLGVVANVAQRVPMGFAIPGDQVFLLGETKEELGGSEWAHVAHQHLGGAPPSVDLSGEQRLAGLMGVAAQSGHLTAAHDLSDGGLSQALVEACLRRNVGVRITLPAEHGPFVQLFSESTGRVLVSVRQGQERAFVALANERGVPCTALGQVQPTPTLVIEGLFEVPLDELRAVHTATLPALFS